MISFQVAIIRNCKRAFADKGIYHLIASSQMIPLKKQPAAHLASRISQLGSLSFVETHFKSANTKVPFRFSRPCVDKYKFSCAGVRSRQEKVVFVACEDESVVEASVRPLLGKTSILSELPNITIQIEWRCLLTLCDHFARTYSQKQQEQFYWLLAE